MAPPSVPLGSPAARAQIRALLGPTDHPKPADLRALDLAEVACLALERVLHTLPGPDRPRTEHLTRMAVEIGRAHAEIVDIFATKSPDAKRLSDRRMDELRTTCSTIVGLPAQRTEPLLAAAGIDIALFMGSVCTQCETACMGKPTVDRVARAFFLSRHPAEAFLASFWEARGTVLGAPRHDAEAPAMASGDRAGCFVMLYERYPKVAERETRTVTLFEAQNGIPAGEYTFAETFCADSGCDCRRTIFMVLRRDFSSDSAPEHVVSIGFGWEPLEFYVAWMRGDRAGAKEAMGPLIEPLGPRCEYGPALLDLFKRACLSSSDYVGRVRRHYDLFKGRTGPSA